MPVGPSYVDCSSLSRSTRSGSVAVPVTGIGRVCGVSASRAPRVITSSPPRSSQAARISAQNCRQRMFGSMPRTRITSRSRSGGEAIASCVLGQVIRRCPSSSSPTSGPVHLEVVELLGVDRPDDPGVPDLDQVVDDGRGRVGGVVPALEGRDDHRFDQVVDLLDLDHSTTVVTRTTATTAPTARPDDFAGPSSRCHDAGTRSTARTGVPRLVTTTARSDLPVTVQRTVPMPPGS